MTFIAIEEAFDLDRFAGRGGALGIPLRRSFADHVQPRLLDVAELRLADMDAHGIGVQVLSLTVPGVQAPGLSTAQAAEDARYANDWLAGVTRAEPGRFRGFAALPLQDPAVAVDELRRCIEELGFVGALVNGPTDGRYLDDPAYDVVWAALERLDVPLYLHPGSPPVDRWDVLDGHPELYGATFSWGAETAAHALRVVYGGVFDRHPGATMILGHMGEFLPFQVSRFDSRYRTLDLPRPLDRMPSAYVGSNIKITNSGVFGPAALEGAVRALGPDAVMFSIDYPWESTAEAVAEFGRTDLDDVTREKVAFGNAAALLRL